VEDIIGHGLAALPLSTEVGLLSVSSVGGLAARWLTFLFANERICRSVNPLRGCGIIGEEGMRILNRLGFCLGLVVWLFPCAGAAQEQTIHCVSEDGGKKYCPADTSRGVRIVKRRSKLIPCGNTSWGYDDKYIWVANGCDADFALGPETAADNEGKVVTCSSDGGWKYCDGNTHHGVWLTKQLSSTPCKQEESWGYDGLGIWVDKGCSAAFALGAAAQPQPAPTAPSGEESGGASKDKSCLKEVGKARSDQLVKQCLQVSPATHPPCNAQNSCELITGEIRRSCGLLGRDAPSFCGEYK